MFVKPVPGRRVRYPGDPSRLLPDEGAEVPDRDLFWRRRLKQGMWYWLTGPPRQPPAK